MTPEEIQTRLGAADELQIRLLSRLSPARRLQTMLELQAVWLDNIRARLRRAHPELSDAELTTLMFERLKQNG
ncbi:MAG: hypothetical protein HZC40_16555 [Chloroflexi bacterium]|nr:hypothetical protein [Chloroflexota bacterium]